MIKKSKERPIVALVGRTNVGKSTLFNRLAQIGGAIVSDDAHTTRDRKYDTVQWKGLAFDLVDSGGMDVEPTALGEGILSQAKHAIRESDMVLFVVDAHTNVLPQDRELARLVKKINPNTWLLANKVDNAKQLPLAYEPEMYDLHLGDPRPVSAATGLGIGDLLDDVLIGLDRLGCPAQPITEHKALRIALIGRPNVGKSSLVNAIFGEDRVIISPIAHTTREPQDTPLRYRDQDIVLVDTAGMRKRAHVKTGVEEEGIERNERAIANADVAILVLEAIGEPTAQDRHLAGLIEDSARGLIIAANKWDLVKEKTTDSTDRYAVMIRRFLPFLSWSPIVFTSAKTGKRATELLDVALAIHAERQRHIDYNAINRLLKTCIKAMRPLAEYGPYSPRIYDVAQIGHEPPTFLISVVGEKTSVHHNWVKFFEKRLREKFGFKGTPIIVKSRNLPPAKQGRKHNISGPGMEAVAGPIKEKKRLVNQTRRRQKLGGHRY